MVELTHATATEAAKTRAASFVNNMVKPTTTHNEPLTRTGEVSALKYKVLMDDG